MIYDNIPEDVIYYEQIINRYHKKLSGKLRDSYFRLAIKETFLIIDLFSQLLEKNSIKKKRNNEFAKNMVTLLNALYKHVVFEHDNFNELNKGEKQIVKKNARSLFLD